MAHIGGNTFGGVTFGIETSGSAGVPDFPIQTIYAKKDIPYAGGAGRTNLQRAGKRQIAPLQLTIIVHADDYAGFAAKVNAGAQTLVWATTLARASRSAYLMIVDDPRQFPGADFWRLRATFEG